MIVVLIAIVAVAAGCAKVVGPYYLEQEKYREGIKVLGEQLKENPDDASSAYFVGRYYLALNKPAEGLEYLDRAAALDPSDADYVFWTGVAHWALLQFDEERAAYEKALALEPDHISANLYLGHSMLDLGEWGKALEQYETVIRLDKYNPEALFGRAKALGGLGKKKEEVTAWKKFLEYYPDGSMALGAVEQLNLQGDFSYRNFIIGKRNITLRSVTFKPGTDVLDGKSKPSLHVISAMMRINTKLRLHIVTYDQGETGRAKARAKAIRDYMLSGNPDIDSKRLPLSWFGTAEIINAGDAEFSRNESVNFITDVR